MDSMQAARLSPRSSGRLRYRWVWFVGLDVRKYSMLKVIAQDFIKPEHIQGVLPLYRELVARTKEEPWCISYDLYINQKDPGHFTFIEEWPDRAALDKHCSTEHFRRLVPQIDAYQRAPGAFPLMDAFQ